MCGALISIRKKNFLETIHMIRAATYHFHEIVRVLSNPSIHYGEVQWVFSPPVLCLRTRGKITEGCFMGMFSTGLCHRFDHCSKFEIFFSNLKIVITDFFKTGFFVKIYCSLVAVKHGKPDFTETQFLGFFQ